MDRAEERKSSQILGRIPVMITCVYGTSSCTPLGVLAAAASLNMKSSLVSRIDNRRMSYDLSGDENLQLVVSAGVSHLGALWGSLQESTSPSVVIVCSTRAELYEYCLSEVPSNYNVEDPESLSKFVNKYSNYFSVDRPPTRSRDMIDAILRSNYKESIVQKLHSIFYRIPDKVLRDKLRQDTMMYLAGVTKLAPDLSAFPSIKVMVDSDLAAKLRKAVKYAIAVNNPDTSAARFNIDRFDIAYVMSKVL